MARYWQSVQPQIKSMFVPLPLEYMEQKITQKQQETDTYKSLLEGIYNPVYVDGSIREDVKQQNLQQFNQDKEYLNNILSNSFDYTELVDGVKNFRQKWQISDIGIPGTKSDKKSGTNSYNTEGGNNLSIFYSGKDGEGNFNNSYYGSQLSNMAQNYDDRIKAMQDYQKMASSGKQNVEAYSYYYIGKKDQQLQEFAQQDKDGGYNQPIIGYQAIAPFDERDFDDNISTQSKGWREDGYSEFQDIGNGFLGIKTTEFIKYDEVFTSVVGRYMGDEQWRNHQTINFIYQLENNGQGGINEDFLNYNLQFYAEKLYNSEVDKLYQQGINNKLKGKELENYVNNQIKDNNLTIENIYNNLLSEDKNKKQEYSLEGYMLNIASNKAEIIAQREGHSKYKLSSPRESFWLYKQKKQAEYDIEHPVAPPNVTVTGVESTPGTTETQARNFVKQLESSSQNIQNAITNNSTQLNQSKAKIIEDLTGNKISNMNSMLIADEFKKLLTNGTIVYDQNTQSYVSNNPKISSSLIEFNNLNREKIKLQEQQTLNNSYQQNMNESWLNSEDGKIYLKDLSKSTGKNIEELKKDLLNGKNITYKVAIQNKYTGLFDYINVTKNLKDKENEIKDYYIKEGRTGTSFYNVVDIDSENTQYLANTNTILDTYQKKPDSFLNLKTTSGYTIKDYFNIQDPNAKIEFTSHVKPTINKNEKTCLFSFDVITIDKETGKEKRESHSVFIPNSQIDQGTQGNTFSNHIKDAVIKSINANIQYRTLGDANYNIHSYLTPEYQLLGQYVSKQDVIFKSGQDNVSDLLNNKKEGLIISDVLENSVSGINFGLYSDGKGNGYIAAIQDGKIIQINRDVIIKNGDEFTRQIGYHYSNTNIGNTGALTDTREFEKEHQPREPKKITYKTNSESEGIRYK